MEQQLANSGEAEAVIIVKALPQVGGTYGETVCVAAVDAYGRWLRLYPITFRQLDDAQRFGRWDKIKFRWRRPSRSKDQRPESRRVDQNSIELSGELRKLERQAFLSGAIVPSTKQAHEKGASLALVKPGTPKFFSRPRSAADIAQVAETYQLLAQSPDLFGGRPVIPREAAPYEFYYRYTDASGQHEARCHDWEIETTFLRRRQEVGETAALGWMSQKFGEEYPSKGMLLAMGTHSQRPWQWMIIGVVRLDHIVQSCLF